MPGRGRGRDRDRDRDRELDRDQGRSKGRPGGKGAKNVQAEGKGKGRSSRAVAANNEDQRARKKEVRYPGERYMKDAKYTASLDGRFWSLSCWPTGERDQDHKLTFGKHKLDVLDNGVVKVVLFGGVNRYKIRLHLCSEGDELGRNDTEGWGLASCEPSAANLQLTEEAEQLGWRIYKGGEHPLLYPPGVALPEAQPETENVEKTEVQENDKGAEASAEVDKTKVEEKGDGNGEAKPQS